MSLDRTGGFDLLIQFSENELNAQIAAAFAAGTFFPSSLSAPVNAFGATGRLDLNLGTPVADLDRPRPQMGLTTTFSNSQLELTAPVSTVIAPLGGSIVIADAVQMISGTGTQQAVLDFTAGAPSVSVTFDTATRTLLTPQLTAIGATVAQAETEFGNQVRTQLVTGVQRLAVTPPIPVQDDTDPLSPFSIDVTTVNDTSAADRDALTFGIRTSSAGGGNINLITSSFIPASGQSVLMLSNLWLLSQVIRPRLAASLGRPVTDFDTPCRLNRSIPAPGGQGTLTNLEARVIGNRIRVDGRATASGSGWSAVSTFSFFIDLALSGGTITVTSTVPTVNTDVSLEWWVWLLSLGLGGLFFGIIGAIIGAIVPAVVEAVAEGIVNGMLSTSISNAVGAIPSLPLGPIGTGITLSSIVLDDLELRGPIQRSLALPIKSSGSFVASGGFTLELDSGTIHGANSTSAAIDLDWDPLLGLDGRNGARFTVTGASYGSLTPVQLRPMAMSTTHLHPGSVPTSLDLPLFGVHSEIVLGVRTNLGRLAKVRAWRSLIEGGAMHIHWTTYDTPIPTLDIALRWAVLETDPNGVPFIGAELAPCTRSNVSRRATIEAWPRLVTFPVSYQWCLCGRVLEPGEGEVETPTGTVKYVLDGRYLTLETEMGQALDCELCVSAIDARNRELFSCTRLTCAGSETKCGKGKKLYPKPKFEWIPCDPLIAIDTWEPITSPRMKQHLLKALANTAPPVHPRVP